MQPKHNKQLVPLARQLRKEMTKEERHLWYDFLRTYPIRFSRQKVLGKYIVDFIARKPGWWSSWTALSTMRKLIRKRMPSVRLSLRIMD